MARTTKKSTKKTNKKKVIQKHLTMRTLLDSLSFSGTVGRTLFVAFLSLICLLLVFFHVGTEASADSSLVSGALLYLLFAVMGFALFDATYIWLQHLHRLSDAWDRVVLFLAELGVVGLFFTPFIIEVTLNHLYVNLWLPLTMIALLVMRYLIGVLFSKD